MKTYKELLEGPSKPSLGKVNGVLQKLNGDDEKKAKESFDNFMNEFGDMGLNELTRLLMKNKKVFDVKKVKALINKFE